MNELAQSIQRLYSADSSPVLGISGGIILFFNAAAERFFDDLKEGARAVNYLPEACLKCEEEYFVTAARIKDKPVSVSGVWYCGLLMLRLNTAAAEYEFTADALLADLRMELGTIRIALDRMLRDPENVFTDKQTTSVSLISHSYYRLLRRLENLSLINNMRNKVAVFHSRVIDPAEWMNSLFLLLKEPIEKLGIKIHFSRPNNVGLIPADSSLLDQLLLNLISNSVQHLKPGGAINLRIGNRGNWFDIIVEDNGPGFTEEQLSGLYQRSITRAQPEDIRRERMGLLVVWGIAALHEGSVTITNAKKGGASVRVTIPARRKSYEVCAPDTPYKPHHPKDEKILVAMSDVLPDACYPSAYMY